MPSVTPPSFSFFRTADSELEKADGRLKPQLWGSPTALAAAFGLPTLSGPPVLALETEFFSLSLRSLPEPTIAQLCIDAPGFCGRHGFGPLTSKPFVQRLPSDVSAIS